jgi:hypothetical protein
LVAIMKYAFRKQNDAFTEITAVSASSVPWVMIRCGPESELFFGRKLRIKKIPPNIIGGRDSSGTFIFMFIGSFSGRCSKAKPVYTIQIDVKGGPQEAVVDPRLSIPKINCAIENSRVNSVRARINLDR